MIISWKLWILYIVFNISSNQEVSMNLNEEQSQNIFQLPVQEFRKVLNLPQEVFPACLTLKTRALNQTTREAPEAFVDNQLLRPMNSRYESLNQDIFPISSFTYQIPDRCNDESCDLRILTLKSSILEYHLEKCYELKATEDPHNREATAIPVNYYYQVALLPISGGGSGPLPLNISKDMSTVVVTSQSTNIVAYYNITNIEKPTLRGQFVINHLAYSYLSSNGETFIASSNNSTVTIYNITSSATILSEITLSNNIAQFVISPNEEYMYVLDNTGILYSYNMSNRIFPMSLTNLSVGTPNTVSQPLIMNPVGDCIIFSSTSHINFINITYPASTISSTIISDYVTNDEFKISGNGNFLIFKSNKYGRYTLYNIENRNINQISVQCEINTNNFAKGPAYISYDGKRVVGYNSPSGLTCYNFFDTSGTGIINALAYPYSYLAQNAILSQEGDLFLSSQTGWGAYVYQWSTSNKVKYMGNMPSIQMSNIQISPNGKYAVFSDTSLGLGIFGIFSDISYTKVWNIHTIVGSYTNPPMLVQDLTLLPALNQIVMTNGYNGIIVIDVTNPQAPKNLHQTTGGAMHQFISAATLSTGHTYAVTAYYQSSSNLEIWDITTPSSTYLAHNFSPFDTKWLEFDANQELFILDTIGVMHIYQISNPSSPVQVTSFSVGAAWYFTLSSDAKYLATFDWNIEFYDVSNHNSITHKATIYNCFGYGGAISGTFLYANCNNSINVFDVSTPSSPQFQGSIYTGCVGRLTINSGSNLAYLTCNSDKVYIYDVTTPSQMALKGTVQTTQAKGQVLSADGNTLYVSDGQGGLRIMDVSLSPSYIFYMNNTEFLVGKTNSVQLSFLQLGRGNTYSIYNQEYKVSNMELYSASYNWDNSLYQAYSALPSWMNFDYNTAILTVSPNSETYIGNYLLYGTCSSQISYSAFKAIPGFQQYEEEDLYSELVSLGYIDQDGYITQWYEPGITLPLNSEFSFYNSEILTILGNYVMNTKTSISVISGLNFSVISNGTFNLSSTSSELSITIQLNNASRLLQSGQSQCEFMPGTYPAVTVITQAGSTITITGTLAAAQETLPQLKVNLEDASVCAGIVNITDGLNPSTAFMVGNITYSFIINQAPQAEQSIQPQIDATSIQTGVTLSLQLAANTFIDPDGDSLSYTLEGGDGGTVPEWLTLSAKGLSLSGTPPDSFGQSYNLKIVASDGFKTASQTFTMKVSISPAYALSILGQVVGPLFGVLGALVYFNELYNVFCKKKYTDPKTYKVYPEVAIQNNLIFPTIIMGFHIVEANRIYKQMSLMLGMKQKDLYSTFINMDNQINYQRLDLKMEEAARVLIKQNRKDLQQYQVKSFTERNLVRNLLIDKISMTQLKKIPQNKFTQIMFTRISRMWRDFIQIDFSKDKFAGEFKIDIDKLRNLLRIDNVNLDVSELNISEKKNASGASDSPTRIMMSPLSAFDNNAPLFSPALQIIDETSNPDIHNIKLITPRVVDVESPSPIKDHSIDQIKTLTPTHKKSNFSGSSLSNQDKEASQNENEKRSDRTNDENPQTERQNLGNMKNSTNNSPILGETSPLSPKNNHVIMIRNTKNTPAKINFELLKRCIYAHVRKEHHIDAVNFRIRVNMRLPMKENFWGKLKKFLRLDLQEILYIPTGHIGHNIHYDIKNNVFVIYGTPDTDVPKKEFALEIVTLKGKVLRQINIEGVDEKPVEPEEEGEKINLIKVKDIF